MAVRNDSAALGQCKVYWAASDVGWVVGHSYIVYGPLLHGCRCAAGPSTGQGAVRGAP